jgi:hypothetical protein
VKPNTLENEIMKKVFSVLLIFLSLIMIGCQDNTVQPGREVTSNKKTFPEFLAGTWSGNQLGWELVIEPNGSISSAVVAFGQTRMEPNKKLDVKGKGGGHGAYEAGDFTLEYDTESREITVLLELKDVYMYMVKAELKGSIEYLISGTVSEDEKIIDAGVFTEMKLAYLTPVEGNEYFSYTYRFLRL